MKESMAEEEATKEVGDMKANIKNMVMNQRAASSKKIAMMKKLADKKKRADAGDIQGIRVKMAKEAMAAMKQGDANKCNPK